MVNNALPAGFVIFCLVNLVTETHNPSAILAKAKRKTKECQPLLIIKEAGN